LLRPLAGDQGIAVYVSELHDTVSPAPTVRPPVMLMSDPLAATAQCTTTVPPPVSSVAVATGDALPVALVSEDELRGGAQRRVDEVSDRVAEGGWVGHCQGISPYCRFKIAKPAATANRLRASDQSASGVLHGY
jgi:hypothetical protein